MSLTMFILLLVAPEHGTKSGPHRASSHVVVVMSLGFTLKLLTSFINKDCRYMKTQFFLAHS
jgi:hypothetical protein